MKKFILMIVVMFFIATFFIIEDKTYSKDEITLLDNTEVRAMYLSYIELDKYLDVSSDSEAKKNIDSIISNLYNDKFNVLILHVIAFSDSIYPSDIYLLRDSVSKLNFDVLEYFIEEAHKYNIDVHAWVNPYRISSSDSYIINENHPAYKFINTNSIKTISSKGIYYNPSSDDVISLIVSGVEEIVSNYDIDGIHFDDYFYPSNDIDLENYELYINSGGDMTIDEYRYDNVLRMISSVSNSIKSINDSVEFGISPQGNIDNNYSSVYLDVKSLLSSNYIDYIMPQIYFGFENSNKPFIDTINEWSSLIKNSSIDLIPALSLYKSGSEDKYAGSGINEWIDHTDILKRQIIYSRRVNYYSGFSIFRYDYFYNSDKWNDNMIKEIDNVKKVIKGY